MNSENTKQIILRSFHENNNSHAFLLVTNNIDQCLSDINDIVRIINCSNDGKSDCNCNVCLSLKNNNNPDYIVVKPDGREIKKEQVLHIIESFNTKPLLSKFSTYTIVEADKLNDTSSNKLLKFLEEPESNIIGFYITDNLSGILPTIKSRCEIFNYRFGTNSILDLLEINEEEYGIGFDIALNFVLMLNDNIKYMLISNAELLTKRERSEINIIIKIIKQFYIIKYENILNNKYNDLEYAEIIINSIISSDTFLIVKRIKLLDEILEKLNYNVNKNLIINKLFILWE